ncbi:hypothetical protein SDC9_84665 [bioreactor metagenome]|uniref:Uncharacterized protein n=1 Tax=bioreactor metagenome TaxID=1076179 RepID=A0A644ZAY3_9ZZZZ
MPLRVVGLVDLGNLADGAHLAANTLVEHVLQRFTLPEGKNFAFKRFYVLRAHLKRILRARRERFDFAVHPAQPRFREDDARANAGGAVADDEFAGGNADFDAVEGFLEGERAQNVAGKIGVNAIDVRNNLRLFNGHVPLLGKQLFLQFLDATSQRQLIGFRFHVWNPSVYL